MIRQLCPHCLKLIELPAAAAGTSVPCPLCAKSLRVPGTYTPTVDPSAGSTRPPVEKTPVPDPSSLEKPPPPGLVPQSPPAPAPAPPPGLVPTMPPSAPTTTYGCNCGFTLSPKVIDWIPAACLTVAFLLTFFSWVGTYPGGVRMFTQSPWGALLGEMSVSSLPEELLRDEKAIDDKLSMNWLMLLYLPLLVVAMVLAWIEKFAPSPASGKWPSALKKASPFWNYRTAALGAIALALLGLVGMQCLRGFGLETAVRSVVAETANRITAEEDASKKKLEPEERKKFVDDAVKNGPVLDTTPKRQRYAVTHGGMLAASGLQTTMWLDLAILAHVLAVLGFALRFWLDYRGPNKPLPRVSMQA